MPKKKNPETPKEQAERFRREAQKLADAGLLTPTDGESGLDAFVRRNAKDESSRLEREVGKVGKS